MERFHGSLRLLGEHGPGLAVTLDLEDEQITLSTPAAILGRWSLSEIGVRGEDDGFHLRVEGEEVVVSTEDDAGFALAVGLRGASPRMARRIVASRKA